MQQPQATVIVPTNKFAPKTLEVKAPSGRTYVLRELTGYEQMQSDGGITDLSTVVYYRTAMSIDSIDGERIADHRSRTTLDAILKAIPGADLDILTNEYAAWRVALAGEIKNEPAPSD